MLSLVAGMVVSNFHRGNRFMYLNKFSHRVGKSNLLINSIFIVCNLSGSARSFSFTHHVGEMEVIKNDGHGGRGIIMLPKSGTYSNVVFWFHGLGDTASGWASAMPSLGLSNTKFILPTADSRPISLNHGMPMPGSSDIYDLSLFLIFS